MPSSECVWRFCGTNEYEHVNYLLQISLFCSYQGMEEQRFSFVCVVREKEFNISVAANALVHEIYDVIQERVLPVVGPLQIVLLQQHPDGAYALILSKV